jgi:hypothetical protein
MNQSDIARVNVLSNITNTYQTKNIPTPSNRSKIPKTGSYSKDRTPAAQN